MMHLIRRCAPPSPAGKAFFTHPLFMAIRLGEEIFISVLWLLFEEGKHNKPSPLGKVARSDG